MDDPTLRDGLRSLSEGDGREYRLDIDAVRTRVRRARRRRALVATAVTSVAVVTVLAGGAVVLGSEEPRLVKPADVPSVGADVRARAAEVYASFTGTERQQNAGHVLRAYAQNGAMDGCMAAKGFPEWDWSVSRAYATPQDPLGYGTWFAEPNRPVLSDPLIAHRQRMLAEEEMNRDDIPDDEDAAIGECTASLDDKLTEEEIEALSRSATAAKLMDAWVNMVQNVSDQAADADSYLRCMDEAEIPVLDDKGIPASEMWGGFSTLGPRDGKIPTSASDPLVMGEAWQEFLAAERVITDADWTCRRDVYTAHIADVGKAIDQFEADHGQEFEQVRQEWAEIETEARNLGHTGQVGPLGT
jgi:hypothetical protein